MALVWIQHGNSLQQFQHAIPLFCFVSGLVASKPFSWKSFHGTLLGVMAPFVLAQMTIGPALRVMDQCIGQQSMYPLNDFPGIALGNVMDPGLLWYLPALVLWRCLGWAFLPLLPGPRLVVSVAVMAWGGYHHLHGDLKWVNQALSLFPVFVMGQLFAGKQVRDRLPPHGAMSVVIGVCYLLVCLGIETGPQYDRWNVSYVYEEKYKTNPDVEIPWLWIRGLAALSYRLSKALAVLYLIVPPQCCFMTQAGQGSLYTYVLHWRIATVLPF